MKMSPLKQTAGTKEGYLKSLLYIYILYIPIYTSTTNGSGARSQTGIDHKIPAAEVGCLLNSSTQPACSSGVCLIFDANIRLWRFDQWSR